MIDLDKLKKMKNLKILLLVCQMIWPFLGLLMSASLLIITSGKSKGSVQFQSGMAVNAEVQAYAAIIAQKAEEHGISEYVQYLMAIMMVESGGTGNDPMAIAMVRLIFRLNSGYRKGQSNMVWLFLRICFSEVRNREL